MANDPSLALREKVVTRLRAASSLTDITTANKVFGEQPGDPLPERPFTRYGVDDVTPRRPSCWDGAVIEFPIHSFSMTKFSDQVRQMNAAVAMALDGAVIDLDEEGTNRAEIRWLNSTILRDAGDSNAWHGIARFRATV
jgi:hypothetical protein